jgi:hypothetical protein
LHGGFARPALTTALPLWLPGVLVTNVVGTRLALRLALAVAFVAGAVTAATARGA